MVRLLTVTNTAMPIAAVKPNRIPGIGNGPVDFTPMIRIKPKKATQMAARRRIVMGSFSVNLDIIITKNGPV